jgi:hypothetical protein
MTTNWQRRRRLRLNRQQRVQLNLVATQFEGEYRLAGTINRQILLKSRP